MFCGEDACVAKKRARQDEPVSVWYGRKQSELTGKLQDVVFAECKLGGKRAWAWGTHSKSEKRARAELSRCCPCGKQWH